MSLRGGGAGLAALGGHPAAYRERMGKPLNALVTAVVVAGLGTASPARAAETTVFGVIASTQGRPPDTFAEHVRLHERHRASYGGPIGIRIFSAGRLPLPADNDRAGRLLAWAAREHPDEIVTVSHKISDEGRLRALLDWADSRKLRIAVIYRHEAQADPVRPDDYRAVYRAYRKVIRDHPAHARVTLEKNLMWFFQRYRSGPDTDWRRYVERDDPADLLSWDVYAFPGMPTAQGRYATPDEFFRYARDAWTEYRLRWAIGEIGTIVQDGDGTGVERDWDPDGSRFTAWVREITSAARDPEKIGPSYAGMPPARFVKWWGALDAQDRDLSLEQVPAAAAFYRGLVGNRSTASASSPTGSRPSSSTSAPARSSGSTPAR